MARILVVDDDSRIRKLLCDFLTKAGHNTHPAQNAAEARSVLVTTPIDVMVLDVMMPGEDGVKLTQSLRKNAAFFGKILLLTARDSIDDRVLGLDAGADDYLIKPFDPKELLARIGALLRRFDGVQESVQTHLKLGFMTFDCLKGVLKNGEESVFLTSSELALLKFMAQSPSKPFTREELAQRIGHRVSERSVDVQIVRLRRKLHDDPKKPCYLQTVRHIGYGLYPDE